MLSKVANHIYWMSRYIERASAAARFLEVNHSLMLDLPEDAGNQWTPLINVTGDRPLYDELYTEHSADSVIRFLVFDRSNPNSIVSCLMKARESARIVRDSLSPELWEEINGFYHLVCDAADRGVHVENLYTLCYNIKARGMLIGGVADETVTHGEAWSFFQLGRLLERADKTSRILDVKYFLLLPKVDYVGTPYDDIQWLALLRSTSALETYRTKYGTVNPVHVVSLLLLDRAFPRSVLCCLAEAEGCLRSISGTGELSYTNPAERKLGLLLADLRYASVEDIIAEGLHEHIDRLQLRMNEIDQAVFDVFFAIQPIQEGFQEYTT